MPIERIDTTAEGAAMPRDRDYMPSEALREAEQKARSARARLRALEAYTGVTLDAGAGAYWLARVKGLEYLAAAVRGGDWHGIGEALAMLDRVPVPVCRIGDHEAAQ